MESDAYTKAIRHIDAGITVFSTATPRFVDIAEQGIKMLSTQMHMASRNADRNAWFLNCYCHFINPSK